MASERQDVDHAAETPDRLTLALSLARQGHPHRAYAMALELQEVGIQAGDERLVAESADCLAYCSMMTTQYEQGARFARIAGARWRRRGDATREAASEAQLAVLLAWLGEPDGLTVAETALARADATGDPAGLVWALQAQCLTLVLLKQPERGMAFGERAVALGRQHDASCPWAYLGLSEALVWTALQRPPTAEASAERDALICRAIDLTREAFDMVHVQRDGWLERLFLNNVAEYSLYRDDAQTAAAWVAKFADTAGEPSHRCQAHHLLVRSRIATAQNEGETALQLLEASRDLTSAEDLELLTMVYADLADANARLGRFEAALAAHRSYHDLYIRRASAEAARRTRLSALQQEADTLRAAAADLTVSNEFLAREAERLLRTSLEDPLTGLPNRRQLDVAFLDLLGSGEPFAVAMLDVDHFKQVNDRFSHAVGDAVLRTVAGLLSKVARSGDLVARYGGEEFALLMRASDRGGARLMCERLRTAVAAHDWSALRPGLAVTVSAGIASSYEAELTTEILAVADRRLYAAKQAGRNRVVAGG